MLCEAKYAEAEAAAAFAVASRSSRWPTTRSCKRSTGTTALEEACKIVPNVLRFAGEIIPSVGDCTEDVLWYAFDDSYDGAVLDLIEDLDDVGDNSFCDAPLDLRHFRATR